MVPCSKQRSEALTKEANSTDRREGADASAASSSLAGASAKFIADQTAVMTMMTAFGMNLSVQMAGAFMGAVADAMEKGAPVTAEPVAPVTVDPVAPVAGATAKPKKQRADVAKVVPLRAVKEERAPVADDLKKISGIGPRLEKVLNGMGFSTWADIAKWTEAEMREIDDKLGLDNRVLRDNWASQAKALLEG